MRTIIGLAAIVAVVAIVLVSRATETTDKNGAAKLDLSKASEEFTDENSYIRLQNVPPEEQATKNERYLSSPAMVVGLETQFKDGEPPGRLARWRHEMLDQRVQVEGVALGKAPSNPSHMTTQRVIYEGGMIFIKGVDFAKNDAVGKTVRIRGSLQLMPESAVDLDGVSATVEKYYYIDADSLKVLDRVTEPRLVAPELKRSGA